MSEISLYRAGVKKLTIPLGPERFADVVRPPLESQALCVSGLGFIFREIKFWVYRVQASRESRDTPCSRARCQSDPPCRHPSHVLTFGTRAVSPCLLSR